MPWFPYPALAAMGKVDRRGLSPHAEYDVILVSGDAYVDHPLFPAAVVARSIERLGLTVAVIAQPDWRRVDEFKVFGRPRLFFGVTAGAMDSMVANYTSMRMPRKEDRMSPGGRPGLRPKRATLIYTQRLREAFPGAPIVLGGVEASLRRFAHFDFWENAIRDPMLIDTGATMIVYGMAEASIERVIAHFRNTGVDKGFPRLPQTCIRVLPGQGTEVAGTGALVLPSPAECRADPAAFLSLAKAIDLSVRPGARTLVQPHPKGDIVCFPPDAGDWLREADLISASRYNRREHPLYEEAIPGLEPVRFSVVSHRGCLGACTFCALALHQGRRIRSRSVEAILSEIAEFPGHPDFHGTVPDLGGPSVNMYGWDCSAGGCLDGVCTHPRRCPNIRGGLAALADLLSRALELPGIKHVFLGSGLRYDLLKPGDEAAFIRILERHVSGQLKVAPEHVDPVVLSLMRKGAGADFAAFIQWFDRLTKGVNKKLFLVPYFMTAFPGSQGRDEAILTLIRQFRLAHKQLQEFTPTPGTLGTAMFATGLSLEGKPLAVARGDSERSVGRVTIQGHAGRSRRRGS
ncbi:MAG: YgiQ family radical SAM protein [Candidatus Riflebacteria bacterium]|nr:YgiQ family radical SAM protein [Candidatus Riflebacteria bacterium]